MTTISLDSGKGANELSNCHRDRSESPITVDVPRLLFPRPADSPAVFPFPLESRSLETGRKLLERRRIIDSP